MLEVTTINLSFSTLYLIREEGKYLMVDAGIPKMTSLLRKRLAQNNIDPEDISLIVLTHVHYDHVGNLSWIKELSKAPVLVHENEAEILDKGLKLIPKGATTTGKILSGLGRFVNPLPNYTAVKPDILFTDIISLKDYGFSATVIPTPGHTSGSISVLFGSGETFVGDTCFNLYGGKSVFPIFANDIPSLMKSWQTLIDSEARVFYPGHGKPFGKDVLKASYLKQKS